MLPRSTSPLEDKKLDEASINAELDELTEDMEDDEARLFEILLKNGPVAARQYLDECETLDPSWLFDTYVNENNVRCVQLLTEAGIEIEEVNMFFFDGKSALLIAIDNNSPEMVRLLLKNGAEVNLCFYNSQTKTSSDSAIFSAVGKGNLEIIDILLENGAFADEGLKVSIAEMRAREANIGQQDSPRPPRSGGVLMQARAANAFLRNSRETVEDAQEKKLTYKK